MGGLRVTALGGISEIGRNMTVFEHLGRLLIIDCGVMFPTHDEPGVDLILPDLRHIEDRLDDIEALVLTHAHEDHIGAIPFLLKLRPLQTCRLNEHRSGSGQPLLNQRILRDVSVWTVAPSERERIAELLAALDEKIAANDRVIVGAERLMVAVAESVTDYVPLSSLAEPSTALLKVGEFDDVVAHFSLPAFDDGAKPALVTRQSVLSEKFHLLAPCVLFARLNPRTPRIWNVVTLPSEMALASTEFVVLRPIGADTSALWAAARQPDISERLRRQVAGTTGSHQRVRRRDLLDVPVRDVRRLSPAASCTITGLGALCHARRSENTHLSALRDALLPLLMSGKVRLSDAQPLGTL